MIDQFLSEGWEIYHLGASVPGSWTAILIWDRATYHTGTGPDWRSALLAAEDAEGYTYRPSKTETLDIRSLLPARTFTNLRRS